ncbi:MAG: DNA adenine methylase [Oscillospiraceae bacterium]|nr:DNA adenine methylase [Oscillospiraceae bacterium]MCL2279846.1 DNA adenine methylase [Oscillospiraceae bacterium]
MEYISAREAATLWGISQRRVAVLCSEGRIEGATFMGNMWLVPTSADKPIDARSARHQPKAPATVKPFLKWAGGKAQILESIRLKHPTELGKSISKYAEPFLGGGAVLFDIISNYDMSEIYISDINRELILTYKTVRDQVEQLLIELKQLESKYLPASDEVRKKLYYENRTRFNMLKKDKSDTPELAALFIAINRTCFNGLYRVNSKGEYNVPQGGYKNPRICDTENLLAISQKLKNVEIICGDYKESASFIDENTFAYFDPPYRPLTESSSFTAYTQDGFGDKEQIELAKFIGEMSARGAHVVASNSDPKNANEQDSFFDDLYSQYKIFRISASRAINSVGARRGKINELLVANK